MLCNKPTHPASSGGKSPIAAVTVPCPHDCPTKVEFKEHLTVYGFDDYTNTNIPWKSVEKGHSDTVKAVITPSAKFADVIFKSSDTSKVIVSPNQATSATQILSITGIAKGEAEIEAFCGGVSLGKMKVKTYSKQTKTVAVRLVHEKNYKSTDIADNVIESYLKKVFSQAVLEFKLSRLPEKTVEFDTNKDLMIDVNSWMSSEMIKIRDACKDDSYDYNIFLVGNPTDGSLGFMEFIQKYGFVHAGLSGSPGNTVAHELGHGAFDLGHPDQKLIPDNDIENLMHSDKPKPWRLRKNQWDKINP